MDPSLFTPGSIGDALLVVPPPPYSAMVTATDDRVRMEPFVQGPETLVLVTIGQSLMANYVGGERLQGGPEILQINLYDGGLYVAKDPLLGVDTFLPDPAQSNFAIRLARQVIMSNRYRRIVILPIAVGGTHAALWQRGGLFNPRIPVAGQRLRDLGLTASAILWQQGTTDNTLGTSETSYRASLLSVIETFRLAGFTRTPFLVGLDSWYDGVWAEPVRAAQKSVVDPEAFVFAGPDIDQVGARRDVAHMTEAGAEQQAALWLEALLQVIG